MNRRSFLKAVPALAILSAKALTSASEALAGTAGAGRGDSTTKPAAGTATTAPASAPAIGDLKPIDLVKPQKDGGMSVLAALWERRTIRAIRDEKLTPQTLSNLLWSAWGVNRPAAGGGLPGRTAASASNSQEMDLYVALAEGVYLYDAAPHRLVPVAAGDFRARGGRGGRGTGAKAPVRIFFVADLAKYNRGRPQEPGLRDPEIQKSYYNVLCGLISGNIYLYAASEGLAAWFHNCDKPGFAKDMALRAEQKVIYAQTVGLPAGATSGPA